LPLHGRLIMYTANSYYDDPEGQMTLVSTTRGRSSTDKADYTKQGDVWVVEEICAGFLPEYGLGSSEYAAFEALLKASD